MPYKLIKLAPTPVRWMMHIEPTSISTTPAPPRGIQYGCFAIVNMMLIPQAASHAVTPSRKLDVAIHCAVCLSFLFRSMFALEHKNADMPWAAMYRADIAAFTDLVSAGRRSKKPLAHLH